MRGIVAAITGCLAEDKFPLTRLGHPEPTSRQWGEEAGGAPRYRTNPGSTKAPRCPITIPATR
ncbi:MAG: hypothetical protein JWQ65_2998 [Devosia sp.]|nr:hypothetical protein [Devosia sp.]